MTNKNETNKDPVKSSNARGLFFLITFSSFLIFLVMVFISLFFYRRRLDIEKNQFFAREEERLAILAESIEGLLFDVKSDLKTVSSHQELQEFLKNGDEASKDAYAREMVVFSKNRKTYDQVRYLDENGIEIIRINHRGGLTYVSQEDALQDKGDRYYFKESIVLGEGEFYLSPMDLNKEGGKVEVPIRPMIRIATPVFYEGEKKGVVILNYFAKNILDELDTTLVEEGEEVYLINQDGYWAKGPVDEMEWGFMYENSQNSTLKNWNSEVWDKISLGDNAQFPFSKGLFTAATIYPRQLIIGAENAYDFTKNEEFWKLISFLPKEVYLRETNLLVRALLATNIFVAITLLATTLVLVFSIKRRVESEETILNLNKTLSIITKILRHDLANMFTHVNVTLELYKENLGNKEILDEIEKSAKQGVRIINQMKDLEGMVSKDQKLKLVDVKEVLNKIAKNYNIEINIVGRGSVFADEAIENVFSNIISNAINHGGTEKIDIQIDRIDKKVQIKFIDYGKGVPDEIKTKIFEEGFKYGETGNTGLGLYIVQQTINRYKGKIWVEHNKPKGAIFIIEL